MSQGWWVWNVILIILNENAQNAPDANAVAGSGVNTAGAWKQAPVFLCPESKFKGELTMSSEGLHAPRDRLSRKTLHHHHAIVSLMEELDAVDWYRQRAEDCDDDALRDILLHNMREEMEHACMVLEWLRRNDADWSEQIKTYLFTEAPITEVEDVAENGEDDDAPTAPPPGFTIGKPRK